jgi:hypothetical protein
MADNDLSRIVNLIMENPKLIEEIKSIAKTDTESEENRISTDALPEKSEETVSETEESPSERPRDSKKRRNELLAALKPYVSKERSRAIDTMISIADILDITRER